MNSQLIANAFEILENLLSLSIVRRTNRLHTNIVNISFSILYHCNFHIHTLIHFACQLVGQFVNISVALSHWIVRTDCILRLCIIYQHNVSVCPFVCLFSTILCIACNANKLTTDSGMCDSHSLHHRTIYFEQWYNGKRKWKRNWEFSMFVDH